MVTGLRVSFVVIFFLIFSYTVHADESFSLKVGYQMLSPSGDLAAEVSGIGTTLDLENDLDLDDSENITAELAVTLGDFKLTAGYLPLSFEGNTRLSRPIIFDGDLFTAGTQVVSSLDVDILDLGLTWYFINMDDASTRFQLGVELAAKITDAEAQLNDLTFNTSESISETLPIPTLGLRGRVAFGDFVGVNGRVGYLGYSDNHFLDADIQLEVSPIPLLGAYAGYRFLDIEIDESDFFLDSDFSGFYAGAFFRF